MKKATAYIIYSLFFITEGLSQNVKLGDYRIFDSVQVVAVNDTLHFPWTGGFLQPMFSNIHLNNDSLTDLIAFDKGSFQHLTFIRPKLGIDFELSRDYINGASSSKLFSLFKDFNGDGKEDQFFEHDGFISINRNVSVNPNKLEFESVLFEEPNQSNKRTTYGTFDYNGNRLYLNIGSLEIPAIGDFDNDGDIDLSLLISGVGTAYKYENKGANQFGSKDSISFNLTDFCWGGFEDNINEFYVNLGSCKGAGRVPTGLRHGGASLTIAQLDCNGLNDLIIGLPNEEKVIGLFNNGTASTARFTVQDTLYPKNSTTIRSKFFARANAVQINNDSINDFLIAPIGGLNSANHKQVQAYVSIKDGNCFKMAKQHDFLSNEHIDIGEQSRFVLIDINGDSLLDILGSSFQLSNGDSVWNAIFYWKNIGTKHRPFFRLISSDFLAIPFTNKRDVSIETIDFNNDSAIDLVLSNEDGEITWLKNFANAGDSCIFKQEKSSLDSIKLNSFPRITFFDFNNDSLPDILAGSSFPELNYYQNKGTKSIPKFDKTPTINKFANISIADEFGNGFLKPVIIATDSLGSTLDTLPKSNYMYLGSASGWIYQFKNDGTTDFENYTLIDSIFLYNRFVSPNSGDLNGDAKPDFIVGMNTGGANLLMKDKGFIIRNPKNTNSSIKTIQKNNNTSNWTLYPNPTDVTLNVVNNSFKGIRPIKAIILKTNSQIVLATELSSNATKIDVSDLKKGIYFLQIKTDEYIKTLKFVAY